MGEGRQSVTRGGSVLLRLGAEILAEVVTHVLSRSHHGGGRKSQLSLVFMTMTVPRPPMLAHLLSARKQFTTFGAGDFLLVRAVLTHSLKREIIIGSHKSVFMTVLR